MRLLVFHHSQDIVGRQNKVILISNLNLSSGKFRKQDPLAFFDFDFLTVADGNDQTGLGFVFGSIGYVYTTLSPLLFLYQFNQNTVS